MDCCKQACVTCSEITTPYCWRTIQDWWSIYKINDGFIHPRGEEGQIKKSKENLPPFLRDNEDLHKKFVRHCTSNLNDLSIDSAKEYVTDHLIPMGFPLTSDFTTMDRENLLQKLYGLSSTPVRSAIWEWLVRCGFNYTKRKKRYFVDTHESPANRKYRKEQTSRYLQIKDGCTAGTSSHLIQSIP